VRSSTGCPPRPASPGRKPTHWPAWRSASGSPSTPTRLGRPIPPSRPMRCTRSSPRASSRPNSAGSRPGSVIEPGPSSHQAIAQSVLLIIDPAAPPAIRTAAAITQELHRTDGTWRITRRTIAPAGGTSAPATSEEGLSRTAGPGQAAGCRNPNRLPNGSSSWHSRSPVMIVFGPRCALAPCRLHSATVASTSETVQYGTVPDGPG